MSTKLSYNTPKGGQITVTKSELRNDDGDPFKVHLDKLVERNKPYFNHLGGKFYINRLEIYKNSNFSRQLCLW